MKKWSLYIIKKIALIILLGLMALVLYSSRLIGFIAESIEILTSKAFVSFGWASIVPSPSQSFEGAKFDDSDIDIMASKVSTESTINQIADKFDISYRQAKKIKDRINEINLQPDIRSSYTA